MGYDRKVVTRILLRTFSSYTFVLLSACYNYEKLNQKIPKKTAILEDFPQNKVDWILVTYETTFKVWIGIKTGNRLMSHGLE